MEINILKYIVSCHGVFNRGMTVNIPDHVAKNWIKHGMAESTDKTPRKIPKGMFWCGKCQSLHRLASPRGLKHLKHRVE